MGRGRGEDEEGEGGEGLFTLEAMLSENGEKKLKEVLLRGPRCCAIKSQERNTTLHIPVQRLKPSLAGELWLCRVLYPTRTVT